MSASRDILTFADEQDDVYDTSGPQSGWKVMIVDDDNEVHEITKLVLKNFLFNQQPLSFVQAFSAAEAFEYLQQHNDVAVILLDVVMESDRAGLWLVEQIRDKLNNLYVRIILRTGQPGQAPEDRVISEYDINDYKDKTELTATKLKTMMYAALRAYRDIMVLHYMPSVLITLDSQLIVQQWNYAAEQTTGIAPTHALKRPLTELIAELSHYESLLQQVLQQQESQQIPKLKLNLNDGVQFYDVLAYPMRATVGGGLAVRLDNVTEQVQQEDVIVQTEKMMSVGGLAAGMAHEINNPLGAILQGIQNINRRTDPELPRNQKVAAALDLDLQLLQSYFEQRDLHKFIAGIQEAGERASHIVSNMLNFSRRGTGCYSNSDIHQLLDRTLELAEHDYDLKKQYDFRHIHVEREYQAEYSELQCLPGELQQVFLNAFKNAAQAMYGKLESLGESYQPTIVVSTRNHYQQIIISIKDNGPGMDDETRKRIFEPFFTTKQVGLGTGLGLSVSYFIVVNNHHGQIKVNSQPGESTEIMVYLPMRQEHEMPDGQLLN